MNRSQTGIGVQKFCQNSIGDVVTLGGVGV